MPAENSYLTLFCSPAPMQWEAPARKYRERVVAIRNKGLGITLSLLASRMFAASVSGYVMQLARYRAWDVEQEFAV